MTTQPLSPPSADVAQFVAQVRAALDDLGPETVDELTMGLEADLSDARAEAPTTWREGVGSPAAYADELRSAAGLPPRAPAAAPGPGDGLRQWWQSLAEQPGIGWVRREGHALAPAWWVIRGAVGGLFIGWLVLGLGGLHLVTVLLVGLGVVVSVWLGRQVRAGAGAGLRVLSAIGTVLAVLIGLGLWANAGPGGAEPYESYADPYPQELAYRGETVQNLYAYGPDGRRIEGVRLYDQRGNAIEVSGDLPGGVVRSFPHRWGTTDPWVGGGDEGWWAPPLTLPPLPGNETGAASGSATSESSSSSSSDPSGTTSGESSSGSSSSGSTKSSGRATPKPRSTSTD